ncbi:ABC transporter permease [Kaistia dalseonensis]|uniref:Polar amino acid transport system permease protein n=1 Tax=Kaistia dalseonensis TaxID=410840 RepID=A0ABU0H2B6_9HYPH|nr:ABC transporter permease [Kaistia dalseonensis]MCX5493881.1 ABC transporter permease [Kaistia dalseonensis]MDQ0436447.1 polar amino acid transport system permease protein [Kaistia dalseonensis]
MNWDLLANYGPRMLSGLAVTLQLVVISVAIGALLSVPLALGRMSKRGWIRRFCFGYVYFFRGTPLLAQTFLVYYGAGQFRPELQAIGLWWLFKDAFFCCVLTFSLNTAAYQAEILRGAILAVPRGQSEAAMSLGLSDRQVFRKIVLPQAFLIALRPLGNELILMIKGSSVAAIVTVFDLMGVTRLAYSRSFDFQVYLWAAVLYLAMVEIIRRLWDKIEHRLTRHMRSA